MATKFRKKPVEVEAVEFRMEDASTAVAFCGGIFVGDAIEIRTLEGTMRADVGDWIIRGIQGEFYPCKPDIFAATYDDLATHAYAPRVDRCRTCRATDVDHEHVERCAIREKAKSEAVAHGRDVVGIHATKVHDLWAHIHTRTGDPVMARDVVKQVTDLGWRPVVGKYDTWTPPAPTTPTATDDGAHGEGL